MGIGGLNDYNSRIANYRVQAIPTVGAEEIRRQDEERRAQEAELAVRPAAPENRASAETVPEGPGEQALAPVRRKDTPLEDVSLTFNAKDDFGYIGQDSDIKNLDVQKAISDMKKDQVIHQYQYFVGNAKNLFQDTADGIVIPKF